MGFRAFLDMDNKVARQKMVENGRKWQRIDFRAFHVMVIEVTRKTMAEMAENGGKWQKMAEN